MFHLASNVIGVIILKLFSPQVPAWCQNITVEADSWSIFNYLNLYYKTGKRPTVIISYELYSLFCKSWQFQSNALILLSRAIAAKWQHPIHYQYRQTKSEDSKKSIKRINIWIESGIMPLGLCWCQPWEHLA